MDDYLVLSQNMHLTDRQTYGQRERPQQELALTELDACKKLYNSKVDNFITSPKTAVAIMR